ncbi:MAG: glutathione synthase [Gammaproteobacteria bacterium]|nr:glutathione synthase [Gammaproteobacteria bacterium]
MTVQLGVVMDPPEKLKYKKDTTIAMLWEAAARNWDIFYIDMQNIFLQNGSVHAHVQRLDCHGQARSLPPKVLVGGDPAMTDEKNWYSIVEKKTVALRDLDVILIRKDPPFDLEYLHLVHFLEFVEREGVLIINRPSALRDANEKIFASEFPQCTPDTLITRNIAELKSFFKSHQDVVCKPLDAMGGESIFRLRFPDENASVIFETLTAHETRYIMVQRYIPEIKLGDKRILMIHGKPVSHALARIPAEGELRGNLAAGGHGVAQPLSARDQWIAEQVGPTLVAKGIYFAGLDVIGDYLTEINITSPTCVREIDAQTGSNICQALFDVIESKL